MFQNQRKHISAVYLQNIQEKYLDYLRKQDDFPVLILDLSAVDFVAEKKAYESIKELIMLPYEKGTHHKVI